MSIDSCFMCYERFKGSQTSCVAYRLRKQIKFQKWVKSCDEFMAHLNVINTSRTAKRLIKIRHKFKRLQEQTAWWRQVSDVKRTQKSINLSWYFIKVIYFNIFSLKYEKEPTEVVLKNRLRNLTRKQEQKRQQTMCDLLTSLFLCVVEVELVLCLFWQWR